jgi:hypothetical protein
LAMIPLFFIKCTNCGQKIFDVSSPSFSWTVSWKLTPKNLDECPYCHKNPFEK